MNYTDGKKHGGAKESLAALINDKSRNPYGTLDIERFAEKLEAMTLDEKFRLCAKVGVRSIANGRSHIMDERLMEAFKTYVDTQPIYVEEKQKETTSKFDYANPPQYIRNLLK